MPRTGVTAGHDNGTQSRHDSGADAVSLHYRALRRVNFASAQNDVAVLDELTIRNRTDEHVNDVAITLRAIPPVIQEKRWHIDRVAPKSDHSISDLATPLELERLAGLDEAEIGELEFRVEAPGVQTIVRKHRIDLLARDEWGGIGDMSQILAAFVSPNDPKVAAILKEAARLLEHGGKPSAIDGYQTKDPSRAYMVAGAIWSAFTGLGLDYAEPPVSFEMEGQKIRPPSRVVSDGLATCLDTTLFLAAAYEAAGLHPVILFSHGHAMTGVWICPKDFGHVTEPDVVAVRKAVQSREFVPIETTLMTKRPTVRFEAAVDIGRRRLTEDRDPEFLMAVDIHRSRAARVRPLASHRPADPGTSPATDTASPAPLPREPDSGILPIDTTEEDANTPADRIQRWQRKLLDLSLRNRLLNFQFSKQTLPLRCPNVAVFEDALASGWKFQGFSLSDDDPVGTRTLAKEQLQMIEEEVILKAFDRRQVAVPLTKQEMDKRFLALYRRARSDLQEGGTNTLFLAAGFLRWKKSDSDTRTYLAPLVLIPAQLERRSAKAPFKISHHDDAARFNSTLLELLKHDFELRVTRLEGDLPRDESGIDIPLVFDIMREKVRDIQGFEVVEKLALARFSFAKYLMWKDLVDRIDQLRKNRLVQHLCDGETDTYGSTGGKSGRHDRITPAEVDRRRPQDVVTPLPADSSQTAAVLASSENRDFILIGPPGTGKSQTITNIIAQCLGEQKTVLFVAEKAAALSVVHRRLVSTGLGAAVLELHSNKTDRKSVLAQLGRAWERGSGGDRKQWIKVNEELEVSRDRLNAYVAALHARRSQGFSVFEAISLVAGNQPTPAVSFESKDAHDEEGCRRLVDLVRELDLAHAATRDGPPLPLVRNTEWSFQWEADVLAACEGLRSSLHDLRRAEQALVRELGLRSDRKLSHERRTLFQTLVARAQPDAMDLSAVPELPSSRLTALADSLVAESNGLAAARAAAAAVYPIEKVRRMPLEQMETDWHAAQAKTWPLSAWARRKVRKLLETYATAGTPDPDGDLEALEKARSHDAAIVENPLVSLAVSDDRDGPERAVAAVRQTIAFRSALADLHDDVDARDRFDAAVADLVSATDEAASGALRDYAAASEDVAEKVGKFEECGGVGLDGWSVQDFDDGLRTILESRTHLRDWVKWVERNSEARAAGLGAVVEALEDGRLAEDAVEGFRRGYARWWLPLAMDASPDLRRFTHWEHEDLIRTFRDLDDAAAQIASDEVMRRIAHALPHKETVQRRSELGTLRHQLNLTRPSMPIRQLLAGISENLPKLAPCVLMSPLSVAQYLPAAHAKFDIVIFDEASQIPTWDAIGAIARGTQTIIVGDSKQLPPTNFFGRSEAEDEELPEVEQDMPSILEEASNAGVPNYHLNWHYRSRDEALIAFSNHRYYGDALVTFPSAATSSDAIRFHKIDGTYARGRGRVNQDEGKAVANLVKRYLRRWNSLPIDQRLTLGVITFNSEQQSLILDLLDEMRRRNPELEWFFDDEREEPVIVKNLENIQGDERDVMLFSVTFGPDLAGKLTMNFGPINNPGGEKRLNVAITRARRKMHVFASLRPDQIDTDRTRATGVRDLKDFLSYAERGTEALAARDEGSLGPAENPFEEAVADALRERGWEVRTQIGVSGFRVDLGVVHPDHAGRFLAGVECDGAQYHSSKAARDRDKVRQGVLEGLGWTILRVWSTEWFARASDVGDRLHGKLVELLEEDRSAEAGGHDPPDGPSPIESPSPPRQGTENGSGRLVERATGASHLAHASSDVPTPGVAEDGRAPHTASLPPTSWSTEPQTSADSQETAEESGGAAADPSRFYDDDYAPILRRIIRSVVEDEGPLTVAELTRRIAQVHGWQRAGSQIRRTVAKNLEDVEVHGEFDTSFAWAPGTHADRIPYRGRNGRSVVEISRAEIASVVDLHADELNRAGDPALVLARHLGVERLRKDARRYLTECYRWTRNSRVAAQQGNVGGFE